MSLPPARDRSEVAETGTQEAWSPAGAPLRLVKHMAPGGHD